MSPPEPPLRLDIDGDALVANWRAVRDAAGGAACGAAVKADGYGLGARAVVERLVRAGARDFFVASWGEAAALGDLPEGARLSVLHGVRDEDMAVALAGPHRPVLNSAAQVARWRAAGGGPADVMVDTGMNRLGLTPAEALSGLLDGLAIDTVMSHLARADEPGDAMNARQREAFTAVAAALPDARASLANSAGAFLGPDYGFDLVRPGIALYGGSPCPGVAMAPVVRPHAQILQLRHVPAGESVGYGATWVAPTDTRVAILNIGYADGYPRALSSIGRGQAGAVLLPLLGRVSMDLVAIAAPDGAGEGDWVALDFDLPGTALAANITQYELLTGLGRRYGRRWT